jgi:hypothetical protein
MELVTHVPVDHPLRGTIEDAVQAALAARPALSGDYRIVIGDHSDPAAPPDDGRIRILVLTPTSVRSGVLAGGTDVRSIADLLDRLFA